MDPQNPGANSRSFPHIDIFGITSLASPINVAPFTGLVYFPYLIRYPSSTAKLNCPVAPTLPPPIDLQ